MYTEVTRTLRLTGSAETKEGAFNKIFAQIKHAIARETSDLVVRIEPLAVEVVSATETSYRERLFGLFFPRTRTRYEITADVSVRLGLVRLQEIPFRQQSEQPTGVKQLLGQR
ncbi:MULTISPECIES: DUF4312 family protein [Brevibacillus]|jgi:uncharacterized protein (TIGR03578 family)|uniref:DUF4312 family protein n=1 Tax=Brevibacillus thermoruber TaxID=33942 RepID=A0A9X3Z554_9BACL|nr:MULTISPECIES: DUF4312 family protein [Brevibacillus]MDA5110671.1 DUF4312 family protein [Brevibacillus thermoruber]TRY27285.1 DUF4312 family protein [Brevibacillus sp. LEMMJ03]UYZ12507.1 DUF4312 family protein [Brevibacillus sp. WF146]